MSPRGLPDRPQDFSAVVAKNWPKSIAYILASTEPCIHIRDDEVGHIGGNRNLVAITTDDLDRIDRDRIWVLGIVLCPGDEITSITAWVRKNRIHPGHLWFFLHPSVDMGVLEPWAAAGYPTNQVDFVEDWGELHSVFGLYLSDMIYEATVRGQKATWTKGRRTKV